jgi:uncharacterized peroxidase-related enzyme
MFVAAPEDTAETARMYKASADSEGFVMNLTRAWAWRPDIFDGFGALRGQLTNGTTLTRRELATLVCATAGKLGDSYCSLAWGRTLAEETDPALAAAVIAASSDARLGERERALAVWARKVVGDPNATTPEDVDALRAAGVSEREIVEATIFVALRLAFSTVNDALGVKPDRQLAQQAPPEVLEVVTFGRATADV